jgi:glycosyltransferase involved in cell wall biosynthesis
MNGFDMEDMEGAGIREYENTGRPEFSLTYTGSFKPNQHIPEIWDGIIELINEDQDFLKHFKLRFVGNVDASVPDYFSERGLNDNIELVDYVPHAVVTRIMKESSALLFVVPQSKNNKLIITGKLFEYLASGSPVLSVGPVDGDASGIISETGRSEMVAYTDRMKFKEQLMELFQIWKDGNGKIPELETVMLDRYSRRSSAELMAQYMKDITS